MQLTASNVGIMYTLNELGYFILLEMQAISYNWRARHAAWLVGPQIVRVELDFLNQRFIVFSPELGSDYAPFVFLWVSLATFVLAFFRDFIIIFHQANMKYTYFLAGLLPSKTY